VKPSQARIHARQEQFDLPVSVEREIRDDKLSAIAIGMLAGRQDSNLGMAESKSTRFAFPFNDHSEKSAKLDPFPINRLEASSECAASAVLFTHSQSGAYGWAMADVRPALVKGIVAIEAGMRPFRDVEFVGAPDYFKDGPVNKTWGIGNMPLAYAPQASDLSELAFLKQDNRRGSSPVSRAKKSALRIFSMKAVEAVFAGRIARRDTTCATRITLAA
jgi:pimeloyl-ACP methyl ester carboxylesterase